MALCREYMDTHEWAVTYHSKAIECYPIDSLAFTNIQLALLYFARSHNFIDL